MSSALVSISLADDLGSYALSFPAGLLVPNPIVSFSIILTFNLYCLTFDTINAVVSRCLMYHDATSYYKGCHLSIGKPILDTNNVTVHC